MSSRQVEREKLIQLRETLIGELHTLPFTIYNDATIEDLLDARPQNLEQLSKVKGFPADGKRLKGFGEAVVQIFTSGEAIQEFTVEVKDGAPCVGFNLKQMSLFQ